MESNQQYVDIDSGNGFVFIRQEALFCNRVV